MRPIPTALCAFGTSGRFFHAPFLEQHPGFSLCAVLERTTKSAGNSYPGIRSYDTPEALFADEKTELVIVNSPNFTHVDFCCRALLAGKHVIVEKPFTLTVSEAEVLIALAVEKEKLLSVYQNRRYDSDFKTVRKVIQEGSLGNIHYAEFRFERYKPALSPKLHKESDIPGAGLLYDLGPHLADQALCLFGLPHSMHATIKITRPDSVVNDYFDLQLHYPGLELRLISKLMTENFVPAYQLKGDNGSLTVNRSDVQEELLKLGQLPGNTTWGTVPEEAAAILCYHRENEPRQVLIPASSGNYMEYYDGIYAAITRGEALPVSAEAGMQVIRILEAAQHAAASGTEIHL